MNKKDQDQIAALYLEFNIPNTGNSAGDSDQKCYKVQKIHDKIDSMIEELGNLGISQSVIFKGEDFLHSIQNELDYTLGPSAYEDFLNKNPDFKKKWYDIDNS